MNKSKGEVSAQIRLTGKTGEIDGLMEICVGMLAMTGLVIELWKSVKQLPTGESQIYIDIRMFPPPLGNLGEGDLPPYTGDNP